MFRLKANDLLVAGFSWLCLTGPANKADGASLQNRESTRTTQHGVEPEYDLGALRFISQNMSQIARQKGLSSSARQALLEVSISQADSIATQYIENAGWRLARLARTEKSEDSGRKPSERDLSLLLRGKEEAIRSNAKLLSESSSIYTIYGRMLDTLDEAQLSVSSDSLGALAYLTQRTSLASAHAALYQIAQLASRTFQESFFDHEVIQERIAEQKKMPIKRAQTLKEIEAQIKVVNQEDQSAIDSAANDLAQRRLARNATLSALVTQNAGAELELFNHQLAMRSESSEAWRAKIAKQREAARERFEAGNQRFREDHERFERSALLSIDEMKRALKSSSSDLNNTSQPINTEPAPDSTAWVQGSADDDSKVDRSPAGAFLPFQEEGQTAELSNNQKITVDAILKDLGGEPQLKFSDVIDGVPVKQYLVSRPDGREDLVMVRGGGADSQAHVEIASRSDARVVPEGGGKGPELNAKFRDQSSVNMDGGLDPIKRSAGVGASVFSIWAGFKVKPSFVQDLYVNSDGSALGHREDFQWGGGSMSSGLGTGDFSVGAAVNGPSASISLIKILPPSINGDSAEVRMLKGNIDLRLGVSAGVKLKFSKTDPAGAAIQFPFGGVGFEQHVTKVPLHDDH